METRGSEKKSNPWSCSEPQILVTRDSRQVHMAEQPASRDRLE